VTDYLSIDLVESLTALSLLWHEANASREKPQPLHVIESSSISKALFVRADSEADGVEVVLSQLELNLLTELGYLGAMQWKGDYSLLYLTPEGITFGEGNASDQELRRQRLIDKLDERQGRSG
jgi:hypothetical protein